MRAMTSGMKQLHEKIKDAKRPSWRIKQGL
jgi:hypothetical protein